MSNKLTNEEINRFISILELMYNISTKIKKEFNLDQDQHEQVVLKAVIASISVDVPEEEIYLWRARVERLFQATVETVITTKQSN